MNSDQVGGRSLIWARRTYRFSEQDVKANALVKRLKCAPQSERVSVVHVIDIGTGER